MTDSNPPIAPPDQPDKKDPSKEGSRAPVTTSSVPDTIDEIILSIIQDWNEAMMFGSKEADAISNIGKKAKAKLAAHIRGAETRARIDETSKWREIAVRAAEAFKSMNLNDRTLPLKGYLTAVDNRLEQLRAALQKGEQ